MPSIPFTGSYEDLSTDHGFQFELHCEKCGNGYMSTFRTSKMGTFRSAARVARDLFGRVAVGGSAHDSALKNAVTEIAQIFKQCTRCGNWVCEPICWNKKAGLCDNCAPAETQDEMRTRGRGSPKFYPKCGQKY